MNLNFELRKSWYFGKHSGKSFAIAFSGWTVTPGIYLNVDGGESEYTIHIGLGIGLWFTFQRIFPKSWYPDYPCTDNTVIKNAGERQISLSIHSWEIWWNVWMDPGEWKSVDPWYRRGNTHFQRWFLGQHIVDWVPIDTRGYLLPFLEGNYSVLVEQKHRFDRYSRWYMRWYQRKMISWEIKAGYHDGKVFVVVPVPHEGKGENSWDLGEDGTFSLSFGGRKEIVTHYQAALYFWKNAMETRERRGYASWIPKKFRVEGQQLPFIKENPVTD